MTVDRCVISYAKSGREDYARGFLNSIPSLQYHDYQGSYYFVSPDSPDRNIQGVEIRQEPPGMFQHDAIPYGFKPFLFNLARQAGHEQVLWIDASVVALQNLNTIWSVAETYGLCVGRNSGCPHSFWCSDEASDAMGVARDAMFEQVMGYAVCFDFRNPVANTILDQWLSYATDGITFNGGPNGRVPEGAGSDRPGYRAHRHDQSVLSVLVDRYSIPHQPYGLIGYRYDTPKFPGMVLANQGIQAAGRWR